jgi:spermidine synthase
MPLPYTELDFRQTDMGDLILRRRTIASLDGLEVLEVKLGEGFLMSSLFHVVEEALATLGLATLSKPSDLSIVVGGLGLGYTAAAVLDDPRVSSLHVIEFMPAVIDWHQTGLIPLGARLVADPRCHLVLADFFALAADPATGFDPQKPARTFDAILLDIDHSPDNLLHERHAPFYTPTGLRQLAAQLTPTGIFAMWSDDPPEASFTSALQEVFTSVTSHIITFPNPILEKNSASTVYIAHNPLRHSF